MRTAIAAVIGIVLSYGITARGSAIQYEQIPADVGAYFHLDLDQLVASRIATAGGSPDAMKDELKSFFGGQVTALTVYAGTAADADRAALVIHTKDFDSAKVWEPRLAAAKHAVAFTYERHVVHYTSQGLEELLNPPGEEHGGKTAPRAQTAQPAPPEDRRTSLTLGMGTGKSDPFRGPIYVSFVGRDLIVITSDLREMADCLDVLDGRKPSLAREDPKGLKVEPPAGVIFVGVGLTANLHANTHPDGDPAAGQDTHRSPAHDATGGFDLDFLGSFRGKATLGRLWGGENAEGEYAHASLTMVDAQSADKLKNVALGLKALVSLSANPEQRYLIDSLTVGAAGKDVLLDWTCPANKTADLVRLIEENSGEQGPGPATAPTTRASR